MVRCDRAWPCSADSTCAWADGYVLSWRLHLDRASTSSAIDIWAQDASWLMNMDNHVAEWSGLTDGQVADAIFSTYGFTPAAGRRTPGRLRRPPRIATGDSAAPGR